MKTGNLKKLLKDTHRETTPSNIRERHEKRSIKFHVQRPVFLRDKDQYFLGILMNLIRFSENFLVLRNEPLFMLCSFCTRIS